MLVLDIIHSHTALIKQPEVELSGKSIANYDGIECFNKVDLVSRSKA